MKTSLIDTNRMSIMIKCMNENYVPIGNKLHFVYVLYKDEKAVYVGSKSCLFIQTLIDQLKQNSMLDFDGYACLEVPEEELEIVRAAFEYAKNRGDLDDRRDQMD